jgi:hypothetical protein
MENKYYNTVGTAPEYDSKIVERGNIDTHHTYVYMIAIIVLDKLRSYHMYNNSSNKREPMTLIII